MKPYWILKIIATVILAILALSTIVLLLWNWLVPSLFNGPSISFSQAVGLLVLSKILFGSFKRGSWGGGHTARRSAWKRRFEEKWHNMSHEDREQFKAKMKRCYT